MSCDIDEEQVLENGIFGGLVLISKSLILRVKGIFLNFLQPPGGRLYLADKGRVLVYWK